MVEVEIGGKTRGFKFGTYTFKLIEQETGIKTIQGVFEKLLRSDNGEIKAQPELNLGFLSTFFYCCAKHYAIQKKQVVDFNEADVSVWFDELGFEKSSEIVTRLIKTYTDSTTKNGKAPETGPTQQ
jgi:hypothetical protein